MAFFLKNMTLTRGTPPCTPHMEVLPPPGNREWQGFSPKTFLHIFHHIVLPILNYAVDVWGGIEWPDLERIYLMACKFIPGVNQAKTKILHPRARVDQAVRPLPPKTLSILVGLVLKLVSMCNHIL